jgi:hypothetical protein
MPLRFTNRSILDVRSERNCRFCASSGENPMSRNTLPLPRSIFGRSVISNYLKTAIRPATSGAHTLRCTSKRNYFPRLGWRSQEFGPSFHQASALLKQIAAPVGGFRRVRDSVRKGHFADFVSKRRAFCRPFAEG